jgi:hypothetical protein
MQIIYEIILYVGLFGGVLCIFSSCANLAFKDEPTTNSPPPPQLTGPAKILATQEANRLILYKKEFEKLSKFLLDSKFPATYFVHPDLSKDLTDKLVDCLIASGYEVTLSWYVCYFEDDSYKLVISVPDKINKLIQIERDLDNQINALLLTK